MVHTHRVSACAGAPMNLIVAPHPVITWVRHLLTLTTMAWTGLLLPTFRHGKQQFKVMLFMVLSFRTVIHIDCHVDSFLQRLSRGLWTFPGRGSRIRVNLSQWTLVPVINVIK